MPRTVKRRRQRGGLFGVGESNNGYGMGSSSGSSWWNPTSWFKPKNTGLLQNNVASVPGPGSPGYFGGKDKSRKNIKGGKKRGTKRRR